MGWLNLVYLGLIGLGVSVFVVFVLLLFRFGFCFCLLCFCFVVGLFKFILDVVLVVLFCGGWRV